MDCIILDIDGTLWDSRPVVAESWNRILDTRTDVAWRATPANLKKLFGLPLAEIAARTLVELPREEQLALMDECCREEHIALEHKPGIIFEGVPETIKALAQKTKVCIVSNCQAGYIELVMDALGIKDYITDFECPGYTGLSKGENCKLVMERNHFNRAVYVGDTQGDADAARLAGIPFVFCAYGFGEPEFYDYKINCFSELTALYDKF